jgi:arsenate reductase (thioredoxin)
MAELGPEYSIDHHTSKSLDDLPPVEFDAAVTMGCGDACPMLRCKYRYDWQSPDPKHMPIEEFRAVRDRIRTEVEALLTSLRS